MKKISTAESQNLKNTKNVRILTFFLSGSNSLVQTKFEEQGAELNKVKTAFSTFKNTVDLFKNAVNRFSIELLEITQLYEDRMNELSQK